ncbi:FeoB-associated Cys-rich membrane protein [Fundidesulfovibrio butyratiphilus]
MLDTIVVSVAILAAVAFLVVRFTRKSGGCASCPPGCSCSVRDSRKSLDDKPKE